MLQSRDVSVFVACKQPINEFVSHLEQILGVQIESNANGVLGDYPEGTLYVYSNIESHHGFLIFLQDYLVNDGNKNFEDYDYEIQCHAIRVNGPFSETAGIVYGYSRFIFDQLRKTNQY